MSERTVKVRFAPSPTGMLHVGAIRTALFDYFFARSKNGVFILRIEDTDQARKVEGAVEQIQESLVWLGVSWDEFATQSERVAVFQQCAKKLVSEGKAREEEGAIRFIVPKEGETSWTDAVGNKKVTFQNKDIEDFIILKKDGFPTYHLANVVDDHEMEITHVIRGEEWLPSTPKHLLLYQAFGWAPPVFAHVPNVMDTSGKKLSKRKGAKGVHDFKKEGILAPALLNYLMLLGWSPKNDREIVTQEEIIAEFTLENIHTSPAVFDERKLLWMNGEYIRMMGLSELAEALSALDPSLSKIEHLYEYLELAKTRMKRLSDFRDLVENNNDIELSDLQKGAASQLIQLLEDVPSWTKDEILAVCFTLRDEMAFKTQDLYLILTGKPQGLPLGEKLEIDGKAKTIEFLKNHL